MIKNIVFDIGNVLLSYQPKKYLETKYQDEKITQRIMEELFLSPYWLKLDEGTMTQEEVLELLEAKYPKDQKIFAQVFEDLDELLPRIESSFDFVKEMKGLGYHLYLLSNLHLKVWEHLSRQQNFQTLFDGYVISSQEKLMKPHQEIYQCLLERYHLKAEETLFLDDVQANIDGAKKVGINGIIFTHIDEVRQKASQLGYLK